jgi:hypothetical protein
MPGHAGRADAQRRRAAFVADHHAQLRAAAAQARHLAHGLWLNWKGRPVGSTKSPCQSGSGAGHPAGAPEAVGHGRGVDAGQGDGAGRDAGSGIFMGELPCCVEGRRSLSRMQRSLGRRQNGMYFIPKSNGMDTLRALRPSCTASNWAACRPPRARWTPRSPPSASWWRAGAIAGRAPAAAPHGAAEPDRRRPALPGPRPARAGGLRRSGRRRARSRPSSRAACCA